MKKSVCQYTESPTGHATVICGREYWAQTTPAETHNESQGKDLPVLKVVDVPSKPKSTVCKKHAMPTDTFTRSAKWRQDGRKRHHHQRSFRTAS